MGGGIKRNFISIVAALALSGCAINQDNLGKVGGTTSGILIGAGAGAVIGKEVGGDQGMLVGAGIGALVGGVAGFFIGDYIDQRRAEQRKISEAKNVKIEFEDIKKDGQKDSNDKVIINNDNQFKSASASLNKDAQDYYTQIAKTYKEKDKKILIVGHTDDVGNDVSNQKLSEKRARAVGKIFAQNGVNTKNIYYQGAGATKPKANNNTAKGRAENRRVEIVELNNESDVTLYASQNTANAEYFTKPKATKTSSKKVSTKKVNPIKGLDFKGVASKNTLLALQDEFGEKQTDGFFSLTTKNTDGSTMLNCANTRYIGDAPSAKSLADDKALPKTSSFKKGLNASSWNAKAGNHLVGVAPVAVSVDGNVAKNPKVYLYKDYVVGQKAKASQIVSTKINTQSGSNGLLYRVYTDDKKSPFRCMDIVFDNKNASKAKGYMYYTANEKLLEKEFELNPIKK